MADPRKKRGKTRRKATPRPRTGLLPGEYKRRALVVVEELDKSGQGSDLYVDHNYIIHTHRLDRQYVYNIEHQGQEWRIPGKVFDQMLRHRDSIIKEAATLRGLDQRDRLRARAEADQREAEGQETERLRDLGGQ